MSWTRLFKTKRKIEPTEKVEPTDAEVDFDRVSVPLGDSGDPTSLLFMISMKHGGTFMNWDDEAGVWRLRVGDREWSAPSQLEALTAAWTALEDR